MIEDEQARKRANKLLRLHGRYTNLVEKAEKRSKLLAFPLKIFQSWALWEFKHDVSHTVLTLIAVAMIVAGAVSIEDWTTGSEFKFVFSGILLLAMLTWVSRGKRRDLLLLYKIWHKGRTEWTSLTFDIRKKYIRELHEKLDSVYPGIELYGKYWKKNWEEHETPRIKLGDCHGWDWENRTGVRLKAICYELQDKEKQVHLEYRRTPAQVYAARFLQTKGIGNPDFDFLKELVVGEEWKIRPKFEWICKYGIGWSAIVVFLVTAVVFWGGPSALVDGDLDVVLRYKGPAIIRAMIAQAIISVVVLIGLVSLRAYVFPAGVFRIDEEETIQSKRESVQKWVIRSVLIGIAAILLQVSADTLHGICSRNEIESVAENNDMVGRFVRGTNICDISRITDAAIHVSLD